MRAEAQPSDPRLALSDRVRDALGALASRPIAVGGVLTLARGIPMTSAHLAALEAAWRFEPAGTEVAAHR